MGRPPGVEKKYQFFEPYERHITRIAGVGKPEWESGVCVFPGQGRRTGEVKYFVTGQEPQARAWLNEKA